MGRFYVIEDFGERATAKTFRGKPTDHRFKIAIAYSGNAQIELIEHVAGDSTYKEFWSGAAKDFIISASSLKTAVSMTR